MANRKYYKCPYTFEDLERLELAIGEGVLKTEHNGKSVTYRSLEEMMKAAHYMRIKLGLVDRPASQKGLFGGKRLVMRPSKGLDNCPGIDEHGEDERFDRNEDT